jgi:hypothetical protein
VIQDLSEPSFLHAVHDDQYAIMALVPYRPHTFVMEDGFMQWRRRTPIMPSRTPIMPEKIFDQKKIHAIFFSFIYVRRFICN